MSVRRAVSDRAQGLPDLALDAEAGAAAERADELAQAEGYSKRLEPWQSSCAGSTERAYKGYACVNLLVPPPCSLKATWRRSWAMAYQESYVQPAPTGHCPGAFRRQWAALHVGREKRAASGCAGWLDYMIGRGAEFTITDCGPKGKALGCILEWRDEYCVKAWSDLDVGRYDLTLNARNRDNFSF